MGSVSAGVRRVMFAAVLPVILATALLPSCAFDQEDAAQNHASAGQPLEYQVKAAFLLNFAKFVEWPATAFAGPDAPVTICLWGEDPFGATLDQLVGGELSGVRKFAVLRLEREQVKACNVLFVAGTSKPDKEMTEILSSAAPGVLTVGEGERFLHDGGMIALVIENRRVRFDINQKAAVNSGLKLSSKLLKVARFVVK